MITKRSGSVATTRSPDGEPPAPGRATSSNNAATMTPRVGCFISAAVAPIPARPALEPKPAITKIVLAAPTALGFRELSRTAQFPRRLAVASPDEREARRSEEHTSELQSPYDLVCRLLLE